MHPKDGHSNTSPLSPPSLDELVRLAELSRSIHPEAASTGNQVTFHRSIRRRPPGAGEVVPAPSQEYGMSASALRDLLEAEAVSLRGHKIIATDTERAIQPYTSRLTIDHVAKQVGIRGERFAECSLRMASTTTKALTQIHSEFGRLLTTVAPLRSSPGGLRLEGTHR